MPDRIMHCGSICLIIAELSLTGERCVLRSKDHVAWCTTL